MMKKIIINYKDFLFKVHISKNNICILDSFRVKTPEDMKSVLLMIKVEPEAASIIDSVGFCNMINEWRVHNLCYSLGIERDRTKNVDLNSDNPKYLKVLYTLLSPFYLNFF